MTRKVWAVVVGAVLLVVLVVAGIRSGGGKDKLLVYVEKASRRDISQSVKAAGQVQARVKVNISAHVIGKIERLFVKEGDAISAGNPFLQLERQAFLAVRDDAKARLAMATTELHQAEVAWRDQEVRLARARKLFAEALVPKESLESSELQHESAKLRVESAHEGINQARALLDKAEDDLRKTTIYAPITGRVVALNAEEGEVVVSGTMNNPASVIGTIADLAEILVEVDVDETDIVHLAEGLAASVEIDALPDEKFGGKVVEVGSSGFNKPTQPDVQFFRVKVLLGRPDPRLRPGMSARSTILVTTHAGAVVIPIQSVVERDPADGKKKAESAPRDTAAPGDEKVVPTVYVVDGTTARQRAVRTGISDATHVEILEGVGEGDRVVTGPYRSLKKLADGDPVKVTDPATEEAKAENDRKGAGG
jgi:HlyD family secretion protein